MDIIGRIYMLITCESERVETIQNFLRIGSGVEQVEWQKPSQEVRSNSKSPFVARLEGNS